MDNLHRNEKSFIMDAFIKEGSQTTLGEIGPRFEILHREARSNFDKKYPDLERGRTEDQVKLKIYSVHLATPGEVAQDTRTLLISMTDLDSTKS